MDRRTVKSRCNLAKVTYVLNNLDTLSILLIIMIVLGVAILIALIVGIIYIVKKRRDFRMVRPHLRDGLISEAETLSKEDV